MPDAIIVDDKKKSHLKIVGEMVRTGLIKMVSVNGVRVYGRHYLSNRAIREAYKRKMEKNERPRVNAKRADTVQEKQPENVPQPKDRA